MLLPSDNASWWNRCQWHVRQLLCAGGLAVGWPQILISAVAVMVFFAGSAILGNFAGDYATRLVPRMVETYAFGFSSEGPAEIGIRSVWQFDLRQNSLKTLSLPWISTVDPIAELGWGEHRRMFGPSVSPPSLLSVLLQMLWAFACWSLFGVAICRGIAVAVAKDRTETIREAVQFAWPRWPLAMGAPAIPLGAILAIGVGLIIVAWFGRLPWIGTLLLSVASPLLMLAGVGIAFLAIVIMLGWPLMVAAMGTDDCDGFGALSRAYSFLTGRPLLAVLNAAISAILGGVLVAVVGGLFTLGLLAEANVIHISIGSDERWATVMQWSHFFAQGLLLSFAASLFWTLATLNYLLLRYEVDGKPFDEIAPDVADVSLPRDLPVVGIPATDYKPAETDGHEATAQDVQA